MNDDTPERKTLKEHNCYVSISPNATVVTVAASVKASW